MATPLRVTYQPLAGSPHSRRSLVPSTILRRLGLPADADWRMAYLGPIGTATTPSFIVGPPHAHGASMRQNGGGGGRQRDGALDAIRTADEYRHHVGYWLELFGLTSRPPVQARYHPTLRLWVVAGVAYRHADGPSAKWSSVLDGPCQLTYRFAGDRALAAELDELARCADLLLGRAAKPGRPSRYTDPSWRTIAEAAEARKADYPSLPWDAIARSYGVQARTLRIYRADLRRELASTSSPTLQEISP